MCFRKYLRLLVLLGPVLVAASQASGQITTLTSSAGTVAAGTAVTLTAAVSVNATPVTTGLVNFCDATAAHCTDVHIIGSAQLTAGGTAVLHFIPGIGTHTYKAVFAGTTESASSTSANVQVVVTGTHPTTTAIAVTGDSGDYTLTATLTGTGSNTVPTGSISFQDVTQNGYPLATVGLAPLASGINFTNSSNPATGADPLFVVAGDFNHDGRMDFATSNRGNGTPLISVFLSNGDGTFTAAPAINVTSTGTQEMLVVADFNSDGNLDIAAGSPGGGGEVTVLLGNGDGTFNTVTSNAGFNGPYAIAVGDFNGDGIPDLVASSGINAVSVALGKGDGTFNVVTEQPATGTYPEGIAVGDFNGDGHQDVAVCNFGNDDGTQTVTILLGDGTGKFTAAPNLAVNPSGVVNGNNYDASDVVSGDFNGDGRVDLAVNLSNRGDLVIFLGNGDGTFTNFGTIAAGAIYMTVADVNGDGFADIISGYALLLGNGDGTFTAATIPPTGGYSIAAGDVNGDGVPDLISVNPSANVAPVVLTELSVIATARAFNVSPAGTGMDQVDAVYAGDGTFAASTSPPVGLQDMQVSTTLTVDPEPADTNYPQTATVTAILQPSGAQSYSSNGETITFFNGTTQIGTGTLLNGVASITTTPGVGYNNYSASYAGDVALTPSTSAVNPHRGYAGMPPVLVATATTLTISAATVAPGTVVTLTAAVTSGPTLVYPGQVNFCDALAATCSDIHLLGTAQLTPAGTATISFVPGIGPHSYKAVFLATGSDATSMSPAQALTVTGTEATQGTIAVSGYAAHYTLTGTVYGTGDAGTVPTGPLTFMDTTNANTPLGTAALTAGPTLLNFTLSNVGAVGTNPQTIAWGDFNGDGHPDLVYANGNDSTLTVLLGNGDGTFNAAPLATTGSDPFSMAVGDFNGDGKQDLVVTDVNDDTLTILLGNGDGTFTAQQQEVPGRPVSVAIGDFNGDGMQDLAIALNDEAKVLILLGNGDGTFQFANNNAATGNGPYSVVATDLNGDGNVDLAVANFTDGTVSILLGNGDGTFNATTVSPATGNDPNFIQSGDFNGDGVPDLAVTNYLSNTVTILLGNGDGTFHAAASPATAAEPVSIAIADFNGDGKDDLAVAEFGSGAIAFYLGNGDGTFTTSTASIATGSGTSFAVAADFNGDGVPDIAAANGSTNLSLIELTQRTQTASATLTHIAPIGAAGAHNVSAVYAGDANFAASTSAPAQLTVPAQSNITLALSAAGAPVGTVTAGTPVTLTATVTTADGSVTTGTVNFCDTSAVVCTDAALPTAQLTTAGTAVLTLVPGIGQHVYEAIFVGTPEAAAITSQFQSLTVTGLYPTQSTIAATGAAGNYTLTGTVVGIGSTTLTPTGNVSFVDATSNGTALGSIALGASTPGLNFFNASNPATGNNAQSVASGDLNGDGLADLVVANGDDDTLTVLLSNGDGTFTTVTTTPATGINPSLRAIGDFNGDGKADLAVGNVYGGSLTILLGNGDGTFTPATTQPEVPEPISIVSGDFNGDGILDLAVANFGTALTNILLGNGDGTFTQASTLPTSISAYAIVSADFNHDGIADLAVGSYGDQNVTIWLGNGDGTFIAGGTYASGTATIDMATGDFNADGNPDLAVVNNGDADLTILLGNGDGTFTAAASPATSESPQGIAIADFNGDGKPDLAVAAYGGPVNILLGNGDGTFTASAVTPTTIGENYSLTTGDFNGDGAMDLAVANRYNNTAAVLLTQRTQTATAVLTNVNPKGTGTHNVNAVYAGDANFNTSSSATTPVTATLPPVIIQTTIPSGAAIPYGPQTITVTVVGLNTSSPAPAPTGTIAYFLDGAAAVPVPGTLTNGAITFTLPQIGVGVHSLNFSYSGDANYAATPNSIPANSLAIPFSVSPAVLTVTANAQTSQYGQPLATLGYAITGFLYNDTAASAVTGVPLLSTTATSSSAPGTYPITVAAGTLAAANYTFNVAPGTYTVTQASDAVTLAVTPNPVRTPNPVMLSATVTSASTGPAGTVTFTDGTAVLGQAPLSAAGMATLPAVVLSVGSHSLSAAYSGNADFAAATSAIVPTTVEDLAVQLTSIVPALATAGAADTPITATGANFTATSILNFNGTALATTYVSATQLQATIPAALLVNAANVTVTVTDTYSVSASQPVAFAILPPVAATLSGPPTTDPGDQPALTFQLQQAFPTDLAGVMTLTFTPAAGSPDNPEVQFATGGRTFAFTLPANSTTAPAILVQAGTVSGTIGISLELSSSGVNVTPPDIQPIAIAVPAVAPTVTSVSYTASGTTLTVLVSGYSSTREVEQATFSFTPISGVTLASTNVTIPATQLFTTWYSDPDSTQYGSSFTYTQTFTLSNTASQISNVGVTIMNSQGTSTEVMAQ